LDARYHKLKLGYYRATFSLGRYRRGGGTIVANFTRHTTVSWMEACGGMGSRGRAVPSGSERQRRESGCDFLVRVLR